MSRNVRVRFAPSPTGYLHVGGARTALFNYCFAKKMGGTFILRIEDTDRNRFVEGALKEIYDSLKWLGLDWTEGPVVGGNLGPYVQSERLDLYKQQVNYLIENGCAYRCFCSSQRLDEMRKKQAQEKLQEGYDKQCRTLSKEEEKSQLDAGMPFVVRFKIPSGRNIVFNDVIRGNIEYKSDVLDDFVLLKSDGYPTYHLANVVDDHAMDISHVLRGDEWIASTPRHILLYEAFGWTSPQFAHMPVILDPSGGKLSKRKGAASVMDYKNRGILPDALFNFLALLGWNPGDDREKMSRDEIIGMFELNKISPKGAVFDEKKLDWMNGLYLTESSVETIAPDVCAALQEKGIVTKDISASDPYLLTVIRLLKDRSKKITDIVENAAYFFADPKAYEEKASKKHFKPETAKVLLGLVEKLDAMPAFSQQAIDAVYHEHASQTQIPIGELVHPTRLALCGISFGPGLFELMELLGKETVLRRLNSAVNILK